MENFFIVLVSFCAADSNLANLRIFYREPANLLPQNFCLRGK